jgi:hypothetical protein
MTQPTNIYYQSAPTNSMGLAGFIVALLGFLTCGILCPIGLILSLIGLRKEPRAFAIAGTVIGGLGTVGVVIIVAFYGFAVLSLCSCMTLAGSLATNDIKTIGAIQEGQRLVRNYYDQNKRLPTEAEGNTLIRGIEDGFRNKLHYRPINRDEFEIRSAGPDGMMNNTDDRFERFTAVAPATQATRPSMRTTMPTFRSPSSTRPSIRPSTRPSFPTTRPTPPTTIPQHVPLEPG